MVNSHEIVTGEFTRNTEFKIPQDQLPEHERASERGLSLFDASDLAQEMMGDSIFSNMIVFGCLAAGFIPISHESVHKAIGLNGAAVKKTSAF